MSAKPTSFQRKTLRSPRTLGAKLSAKRETLKLSLADVERQIKIQESYIDALENDRYEQLPPVYLKGLLRNYATYLGLDPKSVLDQFAKQHAVGESLRRATRPTASVGQPMPRVIITPRRLATAAVLAGIGVIIAYIWLQATALAAPPKISLSEPLERQTISGDSTSLVGQVNEGADLFVNDSAVPTAPDGSFRETLSLQDGLNQIRISAKNKLGKQTVVYRTVLAKLPKMPVATVPATPGVTAQIKVGPNSSWMIVNADGKEIFNGVMLPGTMKSFTATQELKISCGNGGSTNLILTNQKVTNKQIGPLGKEGEIQRDLDFRIDTNVQ